MPTMRQAFPILALGALAIGAAIWVRSGSADAAVQRCLVVNEVMAANRSTTLDDARATSDWIELSQRCETPLDITGYYLSDDALEPRKWQIPPMAIMPGEHRLIWLSGEDRDGFRTHLLKIHP